jgi:cold shock CspA family protein
MLIGLVKWFDLEKGFGVVATPNGREYFLHIKNFISEPEKLLKGTPIVFTPKIDLKKNKSSAENCRKIENSEDWKIIFNHLGKSDIVDIELELTGKSRFGNQYRRKEIHPFSLIELSLKHFLKNKSENEITAAIIDFFESELNSDHFIQYCDILENGLKKQLPVDTANKLLDAAYSYFGKNLNESILFKVWKERKFKYISYNDKDDYEIPEHVLNSNINELGELDLKRISTHSFGSDFCSKYAKEKFKNTENLTISEINGLYQLLEIIDEGEREKSKVNLDHVYANKIIEDFNIQMASQGPIRNNEDFDAYNRLLQNIPSLLNDTEKGKIRKSIIDIIIDRCTDEFKLDLWIKGVVDEIPLEKITKFFTTDEAQKEDLISILSKVETEVQFELLKRYLKENGYEKSFSLIEALVKKENSLGYYFNLSEVLFDHEFWKDKKCSELIDAFSSYVVDECSDEQKYDLFLKGLVQQVPLHIVYHKINTLTLNDCQKIFLNVADNKIFIKDILESKLEIAQSSDIGELYDLASKFLDKENFESFDKKVFDTLDQQTYFSLWENGKAKIFPRLYIEAMLNDKAENYDHIKRWISRDLISADEIVELLLSFLRRQIFVSDRTIFYKQLNHIKVLFQLNENILDRIKQFKNIFYDTILWYLDKDGNINLKELKQKFIYFGPDDQVRIIRKLFYLKASGQFDLTIEDLQELTRFDLDLYQLNSEFNPDVFVDISTEVVIQALGNFAKNGKFIVESEILKIVLKDIGTDRTRRFKLGNYFENCLGRTSAVYDWSRNGEIRKIISGDGDYFFVIDFEFDPYLVEEIKKLPGRKWKAESKKWIVPSTSENMIIEFAKANRFYLNFGGNNYENNTHLVNFNRVEVPLGITFCEGRQANKPHDLFKKTFWWCANQPCFEKCETLHNSKEWEKYTLLDFCEIFGLNTDEINRMNDFINKGLYYQFIGLVNRFNRLLDKLYCSDCNEIMFPVDHSHFAAYSVVRFHCINQKCDNHKEVYLNHCLNGQCGNIIDSRISQKCENGLFICDQCGSCCSHNMLSRRLENLNNNGGSIHNNLRDAVKWKLGHLERAEYNCYNCSKSMDEIEHEVFHCSVCEITYDTRKFRFKRIHKGLPKRNATFDDFMDLLD